MKLTKRDKTLLSFVAVIIILAVFVMGIILPQFDKYNEIEERLTEAEDNVAKMEQGIQSIDTNKQILNNEKDNLIKGTEMFYEMMESYEIERMITKLALDSGLTAKDFLISTKASASKLFPYYTSEIAIESGMTSLEEAQNAVNATQESMEEGEEIQQNTIFSSVVQVKVLGKRVNMEQLVDNIYTNHPSIRVTDFKIQSKNALTPELTITDESELILGLEIYMCDK